MAVNLRAVAGAIALALLAACAKPEARTLVVAAPVAAPAIMPSVVEAKTQAAGNSNATRDDNQSSSNETAQPDASPAYEPPFPDRVDLFVPPKRQGGAAVAKATGEHAVELMGFIRVDRPRAVLAINGEIRSLAKGDSQYGIEVISVLPPHVVLQRGRQRWQATLD